MGAKDACLITQPLKVPAREDVTLLVSFVIAAELSAKYKRGHPYLQSIT